jgi:DNA-binding MarR family transcriptional regulator
LTKTGSKPRAASAQKKSAEPKNADLSVRGSDIEKFRQSEHLGRLLSNGHRVFERIAVGMMRDIGFPELRLTHMALIRNLPLEGRRTTEIADLSNMTKQAVGQLAIELEDAGYVVRFPDPSDGRAKLVKYTKHGLELVAAIPRVLMDTEREIETLIGKAEFQALQRSLKKLAERTQAWRDIDGK